MRHLQLRSGPSMSVQVGVVWVGHLAFPNPFGPKLREWDDRHTLRYLWERGKPDQGSRNISRRM